MKRAPAFVFIPFLILSTILAACEIRHVPINTVRILRPTPGQVFNYNELITVEVQGPAQFQEDHILVNG